jgi:hypothetical protein
MHQMERHYQMSSQPVGLLDGSIVGLPFMAFALAGRTPIVVLELMSWSEFEVSKEMCHPVTIEIAARRPFDFDLFLI